MARQSDSAQQLLEQSDELRAEFNVPSSVLLTTTELGWLKIFQDADIQRSLESDGYFFIEPADIKNLSGREPRLMAKHDFSQQRPWIFLQRDLNILPITRDKYVVGNFNTFRGFPETVDSPVRKLRLPTEYESINFQELTSEATAMNAAFIAGAYSDFLGEPHLAHTVSGRMGSGSFDIEFSYLNNPQELHISRSQIEVDGGYEGNSCFALVEAKNQISPDFNIRQLYYPYRKFLNIVQHKPVRNIYQVYTDGVFALYEYEFGNPADFSTIQLIQSAQYSLDAEAISVQEIKALIESTILHPEPANIPFPQADSFGRVVNICETIAEQSSTTKDEVYRNYAFAPRQADYYINAGRYLGLVEIHKDGTVQLTRDGAELMDSGSPKARKLGFARAILSFQSFRLSFLDYLNTQSIPDKPRIIENMNRSGVDLTPATAGRRASTVATWIRWIAELISV